MANNFGTVFKMYQYILLEVLEESPFDILGRSDSSGTASNFIFNTGMAQIGEILNVAGILSAAIIIVSSLAVLLVAQYPKTRSQTKEKIVNALMVVAFIAAFPFVADVIYTVITNIFY